MGALSEIHFRNYKAFREGSSLEIRPVTLLFGKNSVGKSAVLRLLPLLAASSLHKHLRHVPSIIDYSSPTLRGATFSELLNRGSTSQVLEFRLIWPDCKFDVQVRQEQSPTREYVSSFSVSSAEHSISVISLDPAKSIYEVSRGDLKLEVELHFHGMRIDPVLTGDAASDAILETLRARLNELASSVHWIAAVRAQPPRLFTLEPGDNIGIRHDGSGAAEALRASAIATDGVAAAVSDWLAKACGCKLAFAATDAQIIHGREWFPFNVHPAGTGASVAVRDVGEGVAQSIPVITLCLQAARGLLGAAPLLAFEQPELHLHPNASAKLADAIVDCVAAGSPAKHVIETHSESFLLALQIAVLEGRISQDQVLVYWIDTSEEGSSMQRIEFDGEGYPTAGWPEGVFKETLEQARRIAELRLAK